MTQRPTVTTARASGRSAALTAPAVLAALLLAAAGVAVVQQSLVRLGVLDGEGWAVTTLVWLEGLTRGAAVAVGAGVVILGLLVVWLALAAGRTHDSDLTERPGLVVGHGDVARLSSAAARSVGGVLGAETVASARRVTVTVTSTGSRAVPEQVEAAVTRVLQRLGLDRTVEVTTDVPSGHGGRAAPAAPSALTAAPSQSPLSETPPESVPETTGTEPHRA